MSLAQHLQHQYQAVQSLVDVLEQERLALTCARIDGQHLGELTRRKQVCLDNLQTLEGNRRRGQHQRGYVPGAKGAIQAARDQGCLGTWVKLQELASRASHLNQVNGETLQVRLQQNQRILNRLNEMAGHSLYGPDGRARPRASLSGLV